MPTPDPLDLDVVIFGGGGAGLWLLDELLRSGFQTILLEAAELGTGQTIASQGIIHGGLKYSLDGLLHRSASAIRDMPAVWRECLASRRKPDLGHTQVRAEHCHLWRTESMKSRLGMIGARVGLRVGAEKLAAHDRPAVLANCPGDVAIVAEQVIDPASFVADLAAQHRHHLLLVDADDGVEFDPPGARRIETIHLINPDSGKPLTLRPRHVVFTAGAGNASLRHQAGLPRGAMQRRPLHMVMLRGDLPTLNGHCVHGATTRVTITSAQGASGTTVWQVGGQIAEDGVAMSGDELIGHARRELESVLPGMNLHDIQWATYRVDRAEAASSGRRPDDAELIRDGTIITAWPTKLALVPRLTAQIMATLQPPAAGTMIDPSVTDVWPRPFVAKPPWETQQQWSSGV